MPPPSAPLTAPTRGPLLLLLSPSAKRETERGECAEIRDDFAGSSFVRLIKTLTRHTHTHTYGERERETGKRPQTAHISAKLLGGAINSPLIPNLSGGGWMMTGGGGWGGMLVSL